MSDNVSMYMQLSVYTSHEPSFCSCLAALVTVPAPTIQDPFELCALPLSWFFEGGQDLHAAQGFEEINQASKLFLPASFGAYLTKRANSAFPLLLGPT
jgi:hypothetical protein